MKVYHHLAPSRRALAAVLVAIAVACSGIPALAQSDPLPSWNDTPAKQAIVDFVTKTTKEGSTTFVPPEERIATFDQDGTLWVERVRGRKVMHRLDRVPARRSQEPERKEVEPFKTLRTDDKDAIAKLPMH